MSRSKRLEGVANAAPHSWGHLRGGRSSPQAELVQPFVLLLLILDVLADHRFVPTYGRHEVTPLAITSSQCGDDGSAAFVACACISR